MANLTLDEFKNMLRRVVEGEALSQEAAAQAFGTAFEGALSPSLLAAFLVALHVRGETTAEIAGAAQAMRASAVRINAPAGAMDIVGTGGDGKQTLNISTATALVVAGAGVAVAKHGNRAITSKSGAADVLEALGIAPEVPVTDDKTAITRIEKAIAEANIGFLFARSFHPCMKHITPVRQEMGVRTIFNILGPLCNPAGVKKLLLGVFDERLLRPMAEVLALLGAEHVWVVHGADGLDELSTTGINKICRYYDGKFETLTLSPKELDLPHAQLQDLQGGSAAQNAARIEALLNGTKDAFRDVVLLNAAAALVIADKAQDLRDGKAQAERAIDGGEARAALESLRRIMAA